MILSYIQDINIDKEINTFSGTSVPEKIERVIELHESIKEIPKHSIDKVSPKISGHKSPDENRVTENEVKNTKSVQPEEQNTGNSADDSTFESRYAHFKEKIEKDRLAWETLAKRIT